MDVNDGTDLALMHQAITDGIAGAFPGVHVEFYREDRKNLPLGDGSSPDKPRAYVLLDWPDMEASADAPDPGTEQQAMRAHFEAEIIMRALKTGAKVDVRVLAGALAAYLRKRSRWPGVLNGPIQVVGCYRDDFSPELDQFEVWRVEWTQEIWLGTGVWKDEGALPQRVFLRFVPTGEITQVAP